MKHSKRFEMGGRRTKVLVGWMLVAGGGLVGWGQTSMPEQPTARMEGVASGGTRTAGIPAPGVQPIVSMRDAALKGGIPVVAAPHKKSYDLKIKDAEWMDTGVDLAAGESVSFVATGSETLGDGRVVGPDGLERGWKDLLRQFPLNQARTGALIGRVSDMGASVPFVVGSASTVTMPTRGRLFLRTNVSDDLGATGTYMVKVRFPAAAKVVTTATAEGTAGAAMASAVAISEVLKPEMFRDIPRRVSDEAGDPGDMVNYALLGTEAQVKAAFVAAGWVVVDKTVGDAVLHGLMATLNHDAYTEMPMSTLYLFGRPQDLSFARGDPLKVAAERHHLRVWRTDQTVAGVPLWVGSATHDIGFEKDQRNGKTTHKIDPKIDDERTFLLESFDAAGVFSSAAYITPVDPLTSAKTATGGSFYSDGRIVVMKLK